MERCRPWKVVWYRDGTLWIPVLHVTVLHGGLAVGHWTCDLQVADSIPGRSAFT